MHPQKRDLVIGTRRVLEAEGGVMLCAECDADAAPFSCYCRKCEDQIEREERAERNERRER